MEKAIMTSAKSVHSFLQLALFVTTLFYHYSAKGQFGDSMPFDDHEYIKLTEYMII